MSDTRVQNANRDRFWFLAAVAYVPVCLMTRLWLCTAVELCGDEAYYWLWSKHLDLSYYSKGPGVAWTIALGTRLFGDTEFGVRFPSVFLAVGTAFGLYALGRNLFSHRTGFWTVVVSSLVPLFIPGSFLMTIDPLSIFFWTAAANTFWFAKDGRGSGLWLLTGLLIGAGMLCKYTNAALIPSFVAFCLWCKPYRRLLVWSGFWLMIAVAVACLIPVFVWNYQHGWITLAHLQERGGLDRSWQFSLATLGEFLGLQAAVLGPLFYAGALISICGGEVRCRAPMPYKFLVALTAPLYLFYVFLALNRAGQPNWTAPCFVGALVLMTQYWRALGERKPWARTVSGVSIGLAALLAAAIIVSPAFRLPTERDPLGRVRGAQSLCEAVREMQQTTGAQLLIGAHYQIASLLSFYLPEHPRTYVLPSTRIINQFAFWPTYGPKQRGQDALFVAKTPEVPAGLRTEFEAVDPGRKIITTFKGKPVGTYYLFWCHFYRGGTKSGRGEMLP